MLDEILHQGLEPDRLTYNTLVFACVKTGNMDTAMKFFAEMKGERQNANYHDIFPDAVTCTTLLKGFTDAKDPISVLSIVIEAISSSYLVMDRVAYTATVDALLSCGSTIGALCIFGEILKQVDLAREIFGNVVTKWGQISWTSRGSMAAVCLEALSGFTFSSIAPYLLPQISLDDPINNIMIPFEEAQPLPAISVLENVLLRFLIDYVVPVIDEWGCCIGLVHSEDCKELKAPLSRIMRGPPPCVATSTSIGLIIDRFLEKKYKMIVVVKPGNLYEIGHSPSLRAVGVLTSNKLFKLTTNVSEEQKPCIH